MMGEMGMVSYDIKVRDSGLGLRVRGVSTPKIGHGLVIDGSFARFFEERNAHNALKI